LLPVWLFQSLSGGPADLKNKAPQLSVPELLLVWLLVSFGYRNIHPFAFFASMQIFFNKYSAENWNGCCIISEPHSR
jgi:hypothetical protein